MAVCNILHWHLYLRQNALWMRSGWQGKDFPVCVIFVTFAASAFQDSIKGMNLCHHQMHCNVRSHYPNSTNTNPLVTNTVLSNKLNVNVILVTSIKVLSIVILRRHYWSTACKPSSLTPPLRSSAPSFSVRPPYHCSQGRS